MRVKAGSQMTKLRRFERDIANIELHQADGRRPETRFEVLPVGEHEIGLMHVRFPNGARGRGAGASHWVMLHLGKPAQLHCRVGRERLNHTVQAGNVTICPAQTEFCASGDTQYETLLIAVPTAPLALLAAEHARPKARLTEQLAGFDRELFAIARDLLVEAESGRDLSALSAALFEHLFDRYVATEIAASRGVLSAVALARVHQYVEARLSDAIEVDVLADVAGVSLSNFPRMFRRALGMSPYQYVVRFRLKHAERLIRNGGRSLADIAGATGFVDQSHLSNWIQRVYGTSPARLNRRCQLQRPMQRPLPA
jgi:AraC family transcriptional regulator